MIPTLKLYISIKFFVIYDFSVKTNNKSVKKKKKKSKEELDLPYTSIINQRNVLVKEVNSYVS